jgi:predicted nucleotidyltransferase
MGISASLMDDLAQQRGLLLQEELSRIMEVLIREYQPEKLILFGSAAQGEIHPWSDLDLVVIKKTEKPLLERIEEVLRMVRPKVGLDVLVYTPEELEALVDERRAFVLDEIIYKGAVAYERRK